VSQRVDLPDEGGPIINAPNPVNNDIIFNNVFIYLTFEGLLDKTTWGELLNT
jgi:hypothetical protein